MHSLRSSSVGLALLALLASPLACGGSSNTETNPTTTGGGDDSGTNSGGDASTGGTGNDGGSTSPMTDGGTTHGGDGSTTTTTTPSTDAGMTTVPSTDGGAADTSAPGHAITNVFIIMMENHSWDLIKGSSNAPYINSLLSVGAHAENYQNILHPSEPNYLYLEAGDNLGIFDDNDPSSNHQSTTDHLAAYLDKAGIDWKSWQEDIDGTSCPLTAVNNYAPKHNPFVFFDDMTDSMSGSSAHCIQHVRPYSELAAALSSGKAAPYNFITPNLVDDMHNGSVTGGIKVGDNWLSTEVPKILASSQYKSGGLLIILFDEAENGTTAFVPCIVLSPFAKPGYSSSTKYTHASTLKTMQEIFGVTPLLRGAGAAGVNDLSDMLTHFP
jgi:phospholipase C